MPGRTTKIFLVVGGAACVLAVVVAIGWYWVNRPLMIAQNAYLEGRFTAAAYEALKYLENHPQSTKARLLAARSYYQLGRWNDAQDQFSAVENLPPQDQRLHVLALTRANRTQEASELYQRLCEENPNDADLLQQRIAVLLSVNRADQAIEHCERLARFPGRHLAAYFLKGMAYYQKADYTTAAAQFEQLLKEDPELSDPLTQRQVFWEDLGSSLLRLGRLDDARKQLERGVVLYRSAEILDLLAQVYEAQRDIERAELHWLQALGENPSHIPAIRSLARLELQRDQPEKSVDYLLHALELAPNDVAIHANLSVAYERAGKNELALAHVNRANQLRQLNNLREQLSAQVLGRPNSPEAQLLDAVRDMENLRNLDAEGRLREILRQKPDFEPAQRLLKVLSDMQAGP